jgi:osomolarity two-component system response regulator SKN7
MNDVLAKPFTKDGMVRILRKHLTRMLKDPQSTAGLGADDMSQNLAVAGHGPGPPTAGASTQGYAPANMAAAMSSMTAGNPQVKFEHTPIQSPSTASSWHSPGQQMHPQTSPTNLDGSAAAAAAAGGYMSAVGSGPGGMVLTPGGTQRPQQHAQQQHHAQQHHAQHSQYQQHQQQQQQQQAAGGYAGYMTAAHMGGGEDRPEKRQRLYGPGPAGPQGYVQ